MRTGDHHIRMIKVWQIRWRLMWRHRRETLLDPTLWSVWHWNQCHRRWKAENILPGEMMQWLTDRKLYECIRDVRLKGLWGTPRRGSWESASSHTYFGQYQNSPVALNNLYKSSTGSHTESQSAQRTAELVVMCGTILNLWNLGTYVCVRVSFTRKYHGWVRVGGCAQRLTDGPTLASGCPQVWTLTDLADITR